MPLERPRLRDLRDRTQADIKARLPQTSGPLRFNPDVVYGEVLSGHSHLHFGMIDFFGRMGTPMTATGAWLDRWGTFYGVARKRATPSTGVARINGTAAAVVPAELRLALPDGTELRVTVGGLLASGGSADFPLSAVVAGANESASDLPLTLLQSLPGIDGARLVGSLTGGADAENEEAYRGRVIARISLPPHGGAEHDYIAWALAIPGITRAWAPPADQPGTVVVWIMTDDLTPNGIPVAAKVAEVQAAIGLVRPVTAEPMVAAPTPDPLAVRISRLTPDTPLVRAAIAAEIADMLRSRSQPGGTISRSWIWEAVSRATGETSHEITLPAADVTHLAGHIAVLGTITYV